MKKLVLLFTFSVIFLSCEKSFPENEIPQWLKTKIGQDEQKIKESPKSFGAWGAWSRYKWKNDYYFEYYNLLSSSFYIPISFNGDTLFQSINDPNLDYSEMKCCKQFVWKGPLFRDF